MTEKETRRKISNIIQDCLHENNQSIRFTTNIKKIYKETHKLYTETKFEVFVHFTNEQQKKVLQNTLQTYALKSNIRVHQKDSYTWYFFITSGEIMTEKQSEALDLLTDIIMYEAIRIKAINEEGKDNYDDTEIQNCLVKARECYQGVFEWISHDNIIDIVNRSLDINSFKFTDKRCYGYLVDVIAEDIKAFA